MAVFTPIDKAALQLFLAHYRLGRLLDFAGIPSGITNTNYYVTTEQGEYVLTLFEQLTAPEIPFFLELTAFLAERGIPCPHPVRDNRGHYLGQLHDKPAAHPKLTDFVRRQGAAVRIDDPEFDSGFRAAKGRNDCLRGRRQNCASRDHRYS